MHRRQEVSSPRLLEALSSLLVRGRSLQPPLPVPSCPELLPSPSRSCPPRAPLLNTPSPSCAHLQMDDAGQYRCLAENEMGSVEKVVVLVLQGESPGPWVGTAVWRLWLG